jgi:hypothetical protein
VGVGLGDVVGDDVGVGVGATAGPTVTVDPTALLTIVTFFPLAPAAKTILRLY